jgi:hypothetical protein
MLVRIIKDWDYPDLMRQTRAQTGEWGGIKFTLDKVDECDYVIILNYLPYDVNIKCPKDNIWAIMQEPYVKGTFEWMIKGHKNYNRVFTHYITKKMSFRKDKYISSQPALPWHINKTYDELKSINMPKKNKLLSWVTSAKDHFPGHKKRMHFLKKIKNNVNFDLFGKDINPIKDKWNGLANYKYSLAVENYRGPDYWTEKIADCFLSWTVPIYYGCSNINDYFPKDSYIQIDIENPETVDRINYIIKNDNWKQRQKALEKARDLVLDHYQLFPFLTKKIKENKNNGLAPSVNHLRAFKKNMLLDKLKNIFSCQ